MDWPSFQKFIPCWSHIFPSYLHRRWRHLFPSDAMALLIIIKLTIKSYRFPYSTQANMKAETIFRFNSCKFEFLVNGNWTMWTNWTGCSKSCDNGTRFRIRECANPAPSFGGDNCTRLDGTMALEELSTERCNTDPCFRKLSQLIQIIWCNKNSCIKIWYIIKKIF